MAPKPKYPWEDLEIEYVTGDLSLRDMEKKHNIPLPTIRDQSKKKHWPRKRAEYRSGIVTETTQNKKSVAVMEKAKFDEYTDRTCDVAVAKAAKEITEQYNLEIETEGVIKIPLKTVSSALDIVRQAQEIKYRRLGIPPPKQVDSESEDIYREYQRAYAKELARLHHAAEERKANGDVDGSNGEDGEEKDGLQLVPYDFIKYKVKPPGAGDNS